MHEILPDIPRAYTALAEWLTCCVFILPLKKRKYWPMIFLFMGLGQYILQHIASSWPLAFWIPGMALNVLWMLLTILASSTIDLKQAAYICTKAFITAEFTASFAWQIYCYIVLNRVDFSPAVVLLINIFFYVVILSIVYIVEKRFHRSSRNVPIQNKNVIVAALTAMIVFAISNMGFVLSSTTYSFGDRLSIFLIRTLVNFCGICILYMQENQQYEHYLQTELNAVNNVFQNHYEQYLAYKESSTLIEQKFHDLKHQIEFIRTEESGEKKEAYLDSITQTINTFSAGINTGNGIVDTILSRKNIYCLENSITFTCIVNGELLDFINTMDICSLFGNALDNAIDAVLKISDFERRLINLRVFKRDNFVMILIENYVTDDVDISEGLPETTKSNKDYHGYGLKSIAYIAEKYDGNMTVSMENNWFALKVLLPLAIKN